MSRSRKKSKVKGITSTDSNMMLKSAFALLILIVGGCSPRFDYAILSKGVQPTNIQLSSLSDSELVQLESRISECVPNLSRSLRKYRYQLVPYLNEEGQKLVWVNAFCSNAGDNWKEDPIMVLDGGDCYFNLIVNLTEDKCVSLIINGVA